MLLDGDRADGEAPTPSAAPAISVVVVSWGAEPWLERCVEAILASDGVVVDVLLVDNGCTDGAVERLRGRPGVTVVDPGRNLGFAEGCNAGVVASASSGSAVVALVNPDAVVEPDALAMLVRAVSEPGVGIATCSLRLAGNRGLGSPRVPCASQTDPICSTRRVTSCTSSACPGRARSNDRRSNATSDGT